MKNFLTKKEILKVAVIFILTRLLIALAGFIAFAIFPQNGEVYHKKTYREALNAKHVWNKFDSGWYIALAREDYPDRKFNDKEMATWGFMPLYPMTVRGASYIFGQNYFLTGVILSNLFSFAALLIIYKFLKEKFKQNIDTLLLIVTCAGSFYLSIVYAEGLFLLLTSLIFYLSHKKRYGWAFIFAGLATITRIQGVLLYIIPAIEIIVEHKKDLRKYLNYLPYFVVSLFPLIFLMFYLKVNSGEPLAFIKIQKAWGSSDLYPLQGFLGLFRDNRPITSFVNIMFWVMCLGVVFAKYKYLPLSYLLFTAAYFLLSTSNEIVYGTTRYMLGVIPVFVAVGMSNKYIYQAFLIINVLFLALTLTAFVTLTGTFI